MLDSRSRCSLIRRSLLLLHCHLLFLALLGLNEHFVGLACLGLEVLVVGQQLLEINCLLVEKHTGDGWCIIFTVSLVDCLVNVVTNEVASVITLERVKLGNVHLRKLHRRGLLLLLLHLHLLRWHHHLLSRWLLCWHLLLLLLLLLIVHTHWHLLLLLLLLRLMILVVASSHLTTVVVPLVVLPVVVMLVVMLVSIAIWIVSFLKVSATTTLTSTSSVLESLATTHVLVSIILIVTLIMTHIWTTVHTGWTSLVLRSILLFDGIDKFGHVIDVFISNCILSFVLGLPEVNSKWLDLIIEETHCFIEVLDSLLCFFDAVIENVADLVFSCFDTKFVNLIVFKFDGNNFETVWSSSAEYFLNFLLRNTERNVFDVQV